MQENWKKNWFFVGILGRSMMKIEGIRIRIQINGFLLASWEGQ
jgi:hypothetical protein